MDRKAKPRLAVWKFSSCSGCQLSLLDCEDELLAVLGAVEVAYFAEASRQVARGPYDISLVEGAITTVRDAERIHKARRTSRYLIAVGACATAGGIQALRSFTDLDRLVRSVYPSPDLGPTLAKDILAKATPIADHVFVDYQLRGCPVNKAQLLEVLAAFLHDRRPRIPTGSLCIECKRSDLVCVTVAGGIPCLGPVTQGGCGALCPSCGRGCYGCYGPKENCNTASLSGRWSKLGVPPGDIVRAFRSFNASADPFRKESEAHEQPRS